MKIIRTREEEFDWNKAKEELAAGTLKVGDKITDLLTDGTPITYVLCQLEGDQAHIVSEGVLPERIQWNENGYTRGGFKNSDVCKYLNEDVYNVLPDNLKAVISERECIQIIDGEEERFNLRIWLPTEYEVFGEGWASEVEEGQQFEYFKHPGNRVKCVMGEDGRRAAWWLLSVCSGNSAHACLVGSNGVAGGSDCSNELRVPVCFTIKK